MTVPAAASSANKPTSVRIFWWLSVAIVAYSIFVRAWFLVFPTARYLAVLARLRPELHDLVRHADITAAITSTTIWSIPILALAWLAAFRHVRWARWAFAILFLFAMATDFLIAAAYNQLHSYMASLSHNNWLSPQQYVVPVLWLAAIGFAFSRNSRPWFHRHVES